jgi:hypothetical protein
MVTRPYSDAGCPGYMTFAVTSFRPQGAGSAARIRARGFRPVKRPCRRVVTSEVDDRREEARCLSHSLNAVRATNTGSDMLVADIDAPQENIVPELSENYKV